MSKHHEENDDEILDSGTHSHGPPESYVTQVYPFDKYLITVKLSLDGRFIGIEEVQINKDFRSYKQKVSRKIYHYLEEPEIE